MKFMIITSVVVAMTATFALADGHSVVRMGTEGAYPPTTSSMTPAKSTGSNAIWATSCVRVPN